MNCPHDSINLFHLVYTTVLSIPHHCFIILYVCLSPFQVLYWSLPARFRGNKVTSYGGYLTYSLRYVPSRGEQISTNNAYAVEIFVSPILYSLLLLY